MATTEADLRNDVLLELGEQNDSTVAALETGTGANAYTITSDARIMELLNDAKDEVCKTCFLLYGTATLTTVSAGDGPTFPLSSFTTAGVKGMTRALEVFWTGNALSKSRVRYCNPDDFRRQYPDRATASTGSTLYWATPVGNPASVEVYQRPNVSGTLTATGYCIASDFATSADTFTWLPAEWHRVLVVYACAKICRQRLDDDQLAARGSSFALEYDEIRTRMRSLYAPDVQAKFFDTWVPMLPVPTKTTRH